jgi:hypothetical protein
MEMGQEDILIEVGDKVWLLKKSPINELACCRGPFRVTWAQEVKGWRGIEAWCLKHENSGVCGPPDDFRKDEFDIDEMEAEK